MDGCSLPPRICRIAATISTLVALAVERVAYRPLRHSPRLVLLISAIGASYFLQYTVRGLVGPGIFRYPVVDVLEEVLPDSKLVHLEL